MKTVVHLHLTTADLYNWDSVLCELQAESQEAVDD